MGIYPTVSPTGDASTHLVREPVLRTGQDQIPEYQAIEIGCEGWNCTSGVSNVADLQSAAFAATLTPQFGKLVMHLMKPIARHRAFDAMPPTIGCGWLRQLHNQFWKLVVQAGFGPANASVSDSCRNQAWRLDNLKSFGVGGGTRTHNQGIMIPWHHHCATPTLELEIALAAMCSVLRGRRFTSQPFQHCI